MIKIKNEEIFEEVDEIKSIEAFESDNNKTFFKGSGENLKNYRIYGENGKNLLNDKELKIGGLNAINGEEIVDTTTIRSPFIKGFFSNYRYYLTLFNDEYKIENIYYYNYNYLFLGKIEVNSNYTNFVPISSTLFIKITFKKKNETQNISTLDLENKVVLSKGKAALSYEPYGESVGDKTGNLFDGEVELGSWDITTQPCSKIDAYHVRIRNANFIKVAENSTYSVTMSAEENVRLLIHFLDAQRNYISETTWINNISNFNTPSQCEYINIIFKKGNNEAIALSDIFNIMLNPGSTPLPYEPYGYKVPVTVEGKNLLQNTATSKTINGITFTVNSDGSVICNTDENGATASTRLYLVGSSGSDFKKININANAIITGCPLGGNVNTYSLFILRKNDDMAPGHYNTWAEIGNGFNLSYNETNKYVIYINISTGTICDNLTFYPMIRKADIEDDTYEPYHAPITTNIYLDAPLCKVNGEEEYIDFLTQKIHRIQKNLLPNNTQLPTTINGVKWSIRESDGAIMAKRVSPSESPSDLVYTSSFIAPANQIFVLKLFYEGEEPSVTTYSVNVIYNNIDHWNRNGMYRFETDTEMSVVLRVSSEYNGIAIFAPMISNYNYNDFFDYTPYIQNTEQSIILPAISTFSDTNILSVNTKIKPSKIWGRISEPRDILYVKDNLGNVLFSKYHEIEDEPPLSYTAKKAGFLTDYRIYGQTVDGESVGDRTGNLFDYTKTNRQIGKAKEDGQLIDSTASNYFEYYIPVNPNTTYLFSSTQHSPTRIYYFSNSKQWIGRSDINSNHYTMNTYTFTTPNDCYYIQLQESQNARISEQSIMLVEGSTALPYEPYGYKVPVTVSNGTDTLTIPIYLPEQIKKVGDEAEYIDYANQKQHRVRKNLLQNTATSQTINGVTFTMNSDGSVTCNGTATNSIALFDIHIFPRFSGECILSGCPMNGSQNTYRLQYTNTLDMSYKDYGTGCNIYQFNEIQYPDSRISIRIENGYTCDNLTFYPMIRKADIEDDTYEPYIENTDLDVTLPALPTVTGTNVLTVGTEVQPSSVYAKGKIRTKNHGATVYGIHLTPGESDYNIEYLENAVGKTPAGMNFSTGVFNYGGWENAFFMPRPCMLKYDGTVDYYLDPDNYERKAAESTFTHDDFRAVEYIENTGTQYIDTDISITSFEDTYIDAVMKFGGLMNNTV